MSPIRVLVVEDSLTVRKRLIEILAGDPELEVVGETADGPAAIELCRRLRPDIITLDMLLGSGDGVAVTEHVMCHFPTPILVVSASTRQHEGLKAYDALNAGAVDVLAKPAGGDIDGDWEARLVAAVKLVSRIRVITHLRPARRPGLTAVGPPPPGRGPCRLLAVGASTGGPSAVRTVLGSLPADFPLPILLVLHLSPAFGSAFTDWLSHHVSLPVAMAVDGEPLFGGSGRIVVAPPDRHLIVRQDRLCLTRDPERFGCRPSVDVLFESLAAEQGMTTAACLLTGMGQDGAKGLLAIRQAGGLTIAQDEATSIVYGMPREAARLGAAKQILPLPEIGPALAALVEANHP